MKLIRMWLQALVVEPPETKGGPSKRSRPKMGTPQGGVISPLLANVYLHWFDKAFHATGGPAQWAKAKLVRYADDLVVLARHRSKGLIGFIEKRLESGLGLEINREKTRVVDLKEEGVSLDFPGYTFRYDRDLKGRESELPEYVPVGESSEAGAGQAARHDGCPSMFQAHTATD